MKLLARSRTVASGAAAAGEREGAEDEREEGAGPGGHLSPMLSHPMPRPRRALLIATALAATAGGVAACGEEGISVR